MYDVCNRQTIHLNGLWMWQHDFVRVIESPTQKNTNMDVTNTSIIVKVLTLQINTFWNIEYTETFKYVNVRVFFYDWQSGNLNRNSSMLMSLFYRIKVCHQYLKKTTYLLFQNNFCNTLRKFVSYNCTHD